MIFVESIRLIYAGVYVTNKRQCLLLVLIVE